MYTDKVNFQDFYVMNEKRVYAAQLQSVATPSGLNANLFGPIKGRKYDAVKLRESNLLGELRHFSHPANGNQL